jgi:hypothetical protein
MSEIEGFFVTAAEGHWLVERLRALGRAADVWLAAKIEAAVAYDTHIDLLDRVERKTMIEALSGDVPPRLEEFRAALSVPQ